MQTDKVEHLWVHLHWLTVLAQQGSYTAAAQRLNVSKAAMSQRIAELERAAGVALVQRTTRSVRLTEAGEQLVEGVRASFEQIAGHFAGVRDLAEVPRGLVRLTAPVAFSRQHLVSRLAAFRRQYPEVRLELYLSDTLNTLASEGFDLAIRHTATPPDTHVAWHLCRTRSVLVASHTYLAQAPHLQHPQDLVNHQCLHYPRSQDTPAWHFQSCAPVEGTANRVTVPVNGGFCANNSEALRDAAIDGLGITLVPDFSVQHALQNGQLQEVLCDWQPVGVFAEQLYIIRPYSAHVPRSVSVVIHYLREAFAEGFDWQAPR